MRWSEQGPDLGHSRIDGARIDPRCWETIITACRMIDGVLVEDRRGWKTAIRCPGPDTNGMRG